jgi:hypothetical protein
MGKYNGNGLSDCAYDLAVEAMKKRNEYLSSKEKVNE